MKKIKLSIIVPVYNHEKYLEQCIESILMQEVDFEYEVLIGEDCSTDNSAIILKGMEKKLPENFYIYYRNYNMGMSANGNVSDLIKKSSGEYIIILEGDDYWTYSKKLKCQVEFLDANLEYIAVAHNCQIVDECSMAIEKSYYECKECEYTYKHYLDWILPGQLTTVMYRRKYGEELRKFNTLYRKYTSYPGDRLRAFILLGMGKVYCIQERWSCYRHVTSHGTSFSANYSLNKETIKQEELFFESIYEYAKDLENREAKITSGKLLYRFKIMGLIRGDDDVSFRKVFMQLRSEKETSIYVGHIIAYFVKISIKKLFKIG